MIDLYLQQEEKGVLEKLYDHCDFQKLADEAKRQGYFLHRLNRDRDMTTGYLVYQGYFNDMYNFAYASLGSMTDTSRREILERCYHGIKMAW